MDRMRMSLVAMMLLLPAAVSAVAEDGGGPRIELYQAGPKKLTPESKTSVVNWSETFLKSANFNTLNQPDIVKQGVTDIQERYRKTVRGDYFVVSYDRPTKFKTVAGDVTVVEIIVGMNRPDTVPSALFTIDGDGRVIAHEKYAGMLPDELAPAATRDAR
jgi:hypothetical protein